jgi:hypothetical protein
MYREVTTEEESMSAKKRFFSPFWVILLVLTLSSCGENLFKANKNKQTATTQNTFQSSSFLCSDFTTVRPKVDLLFLWDNSSSSIFINPQTKTALNGIINKVEERFDYHIMLAPLVGTTPSNPNQYSSFFSNMDGPTPGSGINQITKSGAGAALDGLPQVSITAEGGLERVKELLTFNQGNGVFRQGAYTLIVLMSNQDDNSYITTVDNPVDRQNYINEKQNDLLCLRGNYSGFCPGVPQLNSQMMRLISIVAIDPNTCNQSSISQFKINFVYKQMSSLLYSAAYTNGIQSPNDQLGPYIDANDICREDYAGIFDQVNSVIQDTVIKHVYKYWPVANSSSSVDPNTVKVFGDNSTEYFAVPSSIIVNEDPNGKNDRDQFGQPVHGFRFVNGVQTLNTRFLPSPGEPFTGYLVQLFGNAKPTYPSCLRVEFNSPSDFFGFVHLDSKPIESSIVLKINGVTISQSATNGWQLVKDGAGNASFLTNKNLKIVSPTDRTSASPQLLRTGYFLEVFGTAVYSNNASIEITYDPDGG